MNTTEPLTAVIFRKDKDGEIFALFPELPGTNESHTCQSYQHIGQHGSADYTHCIRATSPAKLEEYNELHKELTRIGYRLQTFRREQSIHRIRRYDALAQHWKLR
jgi:hypothetical protein